MLDQVKYIELGNSDIFTLKIGKRITKKEFHNRAKGKYPAYSANVITPFGWVDFLADIDYSQDSVIWGIDGNWTTRYISSKTFFVPTDHCGILQTHDSSIDLKYLSYILKIEGDKHGFSRTYRASLENLKKVSVPIPIKSDGTYDIEKQKSIANRFEMYETLKHQLLTHLSAIEKYDIIIPDDIEDYKYVNTSFLDLFKPIRGNSVYTKKYANDNPGKYPVYSASTRTPLAYIDSYDYDGNYLSWTTNGYGGYIFILSGKFSINGDRGLLLPLNDNINLEYIRYIAQPLFRLLAQTKGRVIEGKKNEYTKLQPYMLEEIQIPIPVTKTGQYDLDAQSAIVSRYNKIQNIKADTIDMLKRIISAQVKII